ncbi:MAG: hypothetical protein J6N32_07065 [Clostridia bacterium]|nr:hypothetical protein [Clostridia bacterium]
MNKETIPMFRSALGGFNRDDVTNYIKETDQKHADELAEMTALLEEAQRSYEELSAKNKELSSQLDTVQTKNYDLTLKLDEVTAQRDEALKENEQSNATFRDLRYSLDKAEADIRELTETAEARAKEWAKEKEDYLRQIDELKTAAVEPEYDPDDHNSPAYKLEMYDKISAQLGDILINANRNADDILEAARQEAETLRLDTETECGQKRAECDADIRRLRGELAKEAEALREGLSNGAASLLADIRTDLHSNVESCIREMNSCVTDMQYEIQTMLARIKKSSDEMNDRIGYYQSSASEGIESRLTEMDKEFRQRLASLSGGTDQPQNG